MFLARSTNGSGSGRVDLLAPVAGCRRALARIRDRLACTRAHSFDVARRGYVNLLLPQDRRSRQPGDAPATVTARLRLAAGGYETPPTDPLPSVLPPPNGDAGPDARCGDAPHP